jgi:hypothetical protein
MRGCCGVELENLETSATSMGEMSRERLKAIDTLQPGRIHLIDYTLLTVSAVSAELTCACFHLDSVSASPNARSLQIDGKTEIMTHP